MYESLWQDFSAERSSVATVAGLFGGAELRRYGMLRPGLMVASQPATTRRPGLALVNSLLGDLQARLDREHAYATFADWIETIHGGG